MKKVLASVTAASVLAFSFLGATSKVWADSAPGDVIISLGENLSADQKQKVLAEMQAPGNALQVTVTNAEEHQYLGSYISKAQIGTRAISSSKITIAEKGKGIQVKTNNINGITPDMYTNALATAGVKDAEVLVTAPFEVSGTAGLTGIFKAYEKSTGKEIKEENKQVANEEMVTTAKIGEKVGKEEAANLMTAIKTELAKNEPKTEADMQKVIETQAENLNIPLSAQDSQQLTDLFMKMKDINIDWGAVGDQMTKMKDKVENFINSEEGKNFFQQVGDFVKKVWQAIVDFFSGIFGGGK